MSENLNIAFPPDFVFKYRGSRNRHAPSNEVINENGTFEYIGTKYPALRNKPDEWFEYWGIDKPSVDLRFTPEEERMGGQLVYFNGVEQPSKGHPFPQACHATNVSKRASRNILKVLHGKDMKWIFLGFSLTSRKSKLALITRMLDAYTDVCLKVTAPYILGEDFLTPCAREINKFLISFLVKCGINSITASGFSEQIANEIEYDNAYRLRIEDCTSETSKEAMLRNPRKELIKMAHILYERDPSTNKNAADTFAKAIRVATLLLLLPKYKRIFRECLSESTFENFQLDAADRYHVLLWADYNFLGKPIQERIQSYLDIYKDKEQPKRIVLKPAATRVGGGDVTKTQ